MTGMVSMFFFLECVLLLIFGLCVTFQNLVVFQELRYSNITLHLMPSHLWCQLLLMPVAKSVNSLEVTQYQSFSSIISSSFTYLATTERNFCQSWEEVEDFQLFPVPSLSQGFCLCVGDECHFLSVSLTEQTYPQQFPARLAHASARKGRG